MNLYDVLAGQGTTHFERLFYQRFAGGAVQTLTGQPPLTFKADGTPLISWSMKGNGQQTGTPSPDNPVMPTFCGVRTGNIVDIESWLKKYNIPYTKTGSTFEFSASSYLFSNPLWFSDEDITISLSGIVKALTGSNIRISTMHADGTVGKNVALGGTSDVRKTENLQAAGIRLDYTYPGNLQLSDIMLNTGSTALPFEPFGYKIPISCAGQTTPLYLGEVSTTRRIRKLVLTGEENWSEIAAGLYRITVNGYLRIINIQVGMSSHFGNGYTVGAAPSAKRDEFVFLVSNSGNNYVYLSPSQYLTTADFKSYLAQQYAAGTPVCVWYVLAEPTTGIVNEPLAKIGTYSDELSSEDAAVTIPTVKGQNVLTVDTDLQPSEMTITYKS